MDGQPDFVTYDTIVNTFDTNGNYTLTGPLPSNPAALIYAFNIKLLDYDLYVNPLHVIEESVVHVGVSIGEEIHNAPNLVAPIGNDEIAIYNTVLGALNKVTVANLQADLRQRWYDAVYQPLGSYLTSEIDPEFNSWLLSTPPLYSFTETDPIFNEWLTTAHPVLTEEDPIFEEWLATTPPLYEYTETDPVFNAWLSATPPIYTEIDPVFSAWLGSTTIVHTEVDPVFTASEAANITNIDITNLSNLSGINTGDQVGDGTTITGSGTLLDPFVANYTIDPATDEKVKFNAADPVAGYIEDKFVSGAGINIYEGTGANENKLVIENIDKGSDYIETDPIFLSSQAANIDTTDITNLDNLSGVNTGDQVSDGTTISGTGTALDPFTANYDPRLSNLESKVLKVYYYASITTNTGTITKPIGSTIILGSFRDGQDALICEIVDGKPTYSTTTVSVTSFDVDGNYTLSTTIPSNPAALIYVIEISRKDYDSYININNIVDFIEIDYTQLPAAVFAGTIEATNLSGTNTGDQYGDGVTITGTGTLLDPFVSVGGGGGSGGHIIQEEGSSLTARTKLNFVGTNVTASDNALAGSTDVTVSFTESDPLSLHLDQTTPQAVINGSPTMEGIQFDITPSTTNAAEGLLRWNPTDRTLDLGLMGGVSTLQLGQEMSLPAFNNTGIDIEEGTPVYISGRQGHIPEISPAKSDSEATSVIFGITTTTFGTVGAAREGLITIIGYVRQIKTNYTGTGDWGTTWVENDKLYVSKTIAGQLTNVEPTTPHHSDIVATVAIVGSVGTGSILVINEKHTSLQELTDVNGTPLSATGQFPVWNNTLEVFDFTSNISDFATSGHTHTHNNLDGVEGGDITHKYHSDQQINVSNNVEFNTVKSTALNSTEAERGFDAKFITGIPDAEKKKFKIVTSYAGGNITASVAFVGAYTSFSYYVNNKKFTVTASTIAAYTKTATAAEGTWFFYVDQSTTDVASPVMILSQTSWGLSDPDALLWNFSFDMTNLEFTWVGHEKHTAGRDIFQHARNHAQGAQYSSGFLFSQYNGLTAFSTNTDDNFGRAMTQISSGYFFDEDLKNGIVHSDTAIAAISPDLAETDWDKFVYQFLGFTALATVGTSATSIVFGSSHTLVAGQAVAVMAGNTTTLRGTTTITTGGTGTTFTVASVTGLASGDAIVIGGRIPIYYIHSVTGTSYTWRKLSAMSFLGVTVAAATWTRSTTTATVTFNNHGLQTGGKITITISSSTAAIPLKSYTVTRTGTNTFTIPCLDDGTASGSITYYAAYNATTIASGVAQYNNAVSGLFTTMTANRYFPMWIMETNFISEPVITILGQGQSTSATLATALGEAPFQFSNLVGLSQLGIAEICPTYRLTLHYNTSAGFTNSKIRLVSATFLDVRVATVSGTIVSGGGTSDHAALSHLPWTESNHTGTPDSLAKFDATGQPITILQTDIQSRLQSYTTTATATATTTLLAASNFMQYFTGSLTQTIVMPDVTTLSLGFQFKIRNLSSGILTVNSSGANLITTIGASCECLFTCTAITGTGSSSWDKELSVITAISIGDFTGAYSGLVTETNWVNNLCTSVAGVSPDMRFGTFGNGAIGYAYYSQSGWNREYTNPFITNSTLIAALQTSGNWTKETDVIYYYAASTGDMGQMYYASGYKYECVDGATHRWIRTGNLASVTITDTTYMRTPQIVVAIDNSTITIPIQSMISSIVIKENDNTGGTFSIGSSDGATDIVSAITLAGVTGTLKVATFTNLSSMLSLSTTKTAYINISTAASVNVYINTIKF